MKLCDKKNKVEKSILDLTRKKKFSNNKTINEEETLQFIPQKHKGL